MIHPKTFKKYKLDTESLKKVFAAKKKDPKVEQFIKLIRDRINDSRRKALADYRVWAAVDLAYDAPFHQDTPTLVRHVLDTCTTATQVMSACRSWGLCEGTLFSPVLMDDGTPRKTDQGEVMYELNAPVFFNVFVPVVRAYVTVRLAKLFNDRNLLPLHKYEPQKYTSDNRILCEIVTDIVQAMAAQFGYAATLRQVIFQSLLYSVCLMFPVESWYVEKQEGEDGKDVTVKEGVRYITPHITRTGWDLQYPLATLNTNTGCSWAFYWSVMKFGELASNDQYWNTKSVTYGTNWMDPKTGFSNYFKQAYPCVLELPTPPDPQSTNREDAALLYQDNDYDKGVIKTEMFMRIKPKQWGLGDYDKEVWFRFTVAADDVIVYAEPFSYNPVLYCGYDADQNRAKNASFALEVLPWQDHLGNILTQILLTIKRNLANIIFFDSDQIDDNQLRALRRRTQWQYQELNFIPFSGLKSRLGQTDIRASTHEVKFSFADTSQMTNAISTVISILERLLVISPQEIGSSASHQQSKAEVVITTTNTNNRVTFTGSFVDEFQDAWKVQSVDACRAFMDPEFVATVSTDIPELETHLKRLGFEVQSKTNDNRKLVVKGAMNKIAGVDSFASTREGPERGNDTAAAQAEYQAVQSINQNPLLTQIVDPESIIQLIESAARKAGADRDFKVRVNKGGPPAEQLKQALAQAEQAISGKVTQDVMQTVAKEFGEPAAKAMHEQQTQIDQNSKGIEAVNQQTAQLAEVVKKLQEMIFNALQAPPAPPVQPPMQPPGTPLPPEAMMSPPPNEAQQVPIAPEGAGVPAGVPS